LYGLDTYKNRYLTANHGLGTFFPLLKHSLLPQRLITILYSNPYVYVSFDGWNWQFNDLGPFCYCFG